MYSFENVVRYSETAPDKKLSLFGLVNYFQDCSNFQSNALDVGVDELMKAKLAWILSYWKIDVRRRPEMGECITTGTWAYGFEHFLGHRNFLMSDENGKVLACADSVWVLVNTDTGRPAVKTGKFTEAYSVEPKYEDMVYESRKIKAAQSFEKLESFKVPKSCLDTNNHVNNAYYIQMAQEYLPDDFNLSSVRVDYKQQAFPQDVIVPHIGMTDTGRFQVDLRNTDDATYALVEFSK